MIRITGCSKEEERQSLTEKEEEYDEPTDDNNEEPNLIDSHQQEPQENPPSPPTPRRRRSPPPTPRRRSPRTSDERMRNQELKDRIWYNIDAMVNDEDDEVTLYQGSEDEGCRSCPPESPPKDKDEKHPDEVNAREYG
jgi:hypothetical protein